MSLRTLIQAAMYLAGSGGLAGSGMTLDELRSLG